MTQLEELYSLPSGSWLMREARISMNRENLVLQYSCSTIDSGIFRSGIVLEWFKAFRYLAESFTTLFETEAYNCLVEVLDSPWLEELNGIARSRGQYMEGFHHYMIYLNDDGSYEFIARGWSVLPEEPGAWEADLD